MKTYEVIITSTTDDGACSEFKRTYNSKEDAQLCIRVAIDSLMPDEDAHAILFTLEDGVRVAVEEYPIVEDSENE